MHRTNMLNIFLFEIQSKMLQLSVIAYNYFSKRIYKAVLNVVGGDVMLNNFCLCGLFQHNQGALIN